MAIFNSAAYIIVLSTFTMLEILKDSLSEATKYNIVGHLIILFLSITVGANLLVGLVSSIIAFRDLGRAYIWGKKAKKGDDKLAKGNEPDLDDSSVNGLNQILPEPKSKFKKKIRGRKVKKERVVSNRLRNKSKSKKVEPKENKVKKTVSNPGQKKPSRNRSPAKRLKELLDRKKSAPRRKVSKQ